MGIPLEAKSSEQTEGVRIDPLASRAAEDILTIFDQLAMDPSEIDLLKIPVVSAYVKGMQALPHDSENINLDGLTDQVHLVLARKLALRQLLAGEEPVLPCVW